MKVIIINGPNLNLLGVREKSIYGDQTFEKYLKKLKDNNQDITIEYFQSNHEGSIIDKIHETGFSYDGIILNAGAYTHTSLAIADAIASVNTPVIEVHISNVYRREDFRKKSFISANCAGIIVGFGLSGYNLALNHLKEINS